MDTTAPTSLLKTVQPTPRKSFEQKEEAVEVVVSQGQSQQEQQRRMPSRSRDWNNPERCGQGPDASPSQQPPPSSSLYLHPFVELRPVIFKTNVKGDENVGIDYVGNEEGSEAGRRVSLLEPTPPPLTGGAFDESPAAPSREEQKGEEIRGLCGAGLPNATDTGVTLVSRMRLNLQPTAPPPPQLGSHPAMDTTREKETNNSSCVRQTPRFFFRTTAHATPRGAEEQQRLPGSNDEVCLRHDNALSTSRCAVNFTAEAKERRDEGEEEESRAGVPRQQRQQQQQTLLPLVIGPMNVTGEEVGPPAKRLRTSSEWGELMSPTPTPHGVYSCGCTPTVRRHSKTGVPLPSGPTPVDFSSVTEYVESKYEVGTKISEGTYGEVYIGRDCKTGMTVALKRLKVLQGLDGFPITSIREVIALKHINKIRQHVPASHADDGSKSDPIQEVIGLSDVLLSRNHHDIFLVFPYATCSMAGLLQRRFPLTEREIAYVFKKVLTALMKLHSMGIIHRDVKADNVLIHRDGQVQLGDLGMCVFEGSGRRALTPSLINLSYRPPEMLLGINSYDIKVDIWSVGCFLAQMYLRTPPFFLANRQGSGGGGGNVDARQHHSSHHRRVGTELEQLSLITDVLGPLSSAGPDAFPKERCQRFEQLEKLRQALATPVNSPSSFTPSLGSLFQPSFLFQEFNGFAAWFKATAEHRRRDSSHLTPSQECVDVLTAIFQLDPRKRPTAAQLLAMPFFDLSRGGEKTRENGLLELQIQRELAGKMMQYHNSHIAPPTEKR